MGHFEPIFFDLKIKSVITDKIINLNHAITNPYPLGLIMAWFFCAEKMGFIERLRTKSPNDNAGNVSQTPSRYL
jgi:hypothetical protein